MAIFKSWKTELDTPTITRMMPMPVTVTAKLPPWSSGGGAATTNLLPQNISVLGKTVGSDGNLWVALPDRTNVDVTPVIAGASDYYTFNVSAQKYPLSLTASTNGTAVDLSTNTPEFCVGQKVTFILNGLPMGNVVNMVGQWNLPGNYKNDHTNAVEDGSSPNSSEIYFINTDLLANTNQTSCWYLNKPGGQVSVGLSLQFNNGQAASVAAIGNFTIYRPSISVENQTDDLHSFILTTAGLLGYPCVAMWEEITETNDIKHGMNYYVLYDIGKYSGDGELTQLLTADYSGLGAPNFSDWRLDGNTEAYSPSVDLDSSKLPSLRPVILTDNPGNAHLRYTTIRCKASFEDYCRFKPKGDGIYVTLGIVRWNCDGESPSVGVISTNSVIGPSDPDGSDVFPEWTQKLSAGSKNGN